MYGLRENDIKLIRDIGTSRANIKQILLFGSRAKGCQKPSSDVDLAIVGDLQPPEIWEIAGLLNDELPTPYTYDVVHYDALTNTKMKEDIKSVGKVIYEK